MACPVTPPAEMLIGYFPFVFLTMENIATVANWLEVALASISVESISIAESYGKLI